MTTLIVDVQEFPLFEGQEMGRELELELTAVVLKVNPEEGGSLSAEGGIPSGSVVLAIMRADIVQTT